MKETFKIIISDFLETEMPKLVDREIEIPLSSKKIISLVGARRTGKTYLFYSVIKRLRESQQNSQIVYINFEDDRLFPLTLKDLNLFVEAYYELYPNNRDKTAYFFFDEIHNVENWEKFVRRIYDSLNCNIFITGSSSKFLSKEIATSLRGRTISFEVFPFNFTEYLKIKGIDSNYLSSKNRAKIVNAFEYYLHNSSFPELLEATEIEKPKILKEYLDLVIYKDLIERYQITNLYLIKYLIKFLLSNSANLISISKIYNDLKSQSVKVSKNSLYQYIEYLTDAYILFPVKIFSNNIREVQRNPQKIYSLDSGLVDIVTITKDIGRKFENTLFLELRRKHQNVSYVKLKQEIDFCYQYNGKMNLINASYSIKETSTKQREINSLVEGMKYFNIKESFLLTNSNEETISIEDMEIKILPLWKWLIMNY
ncbi:MAG: ATP-binding protein [Bacteroidetes bacterium]|nr:ATP-binding protein [Bacteroidota bacterium]MBU1115103.1 ATP-binding protein [Bacteroidota bacterium]MBU1798715.1 ATP-binding protein [Bacteroidota bacterium]